MSASKAVANLELKAGMLLRHYKGNIYKVLHPTVRHSEFPESDGDMVVYIPCLKDGTPKPYSDIWTRPKSMFSEQVETLNGTKQRFTPVEYFIKE